MRCYPLNSQVGRFNCHSGNTSTPYLEHTEICYVIWDYFLPRTVSMCSGHWCFLNANTKFLGTKSVSQQTTEFLSICVSSFSFADIDCHTSMPTSHCGIACGICMITWPCFNGRGNRFESQPVCLLSCLILLMVPLIFFLWIPDSNLKIGHDRLLTLFMIIFPSHSSACIQ